MKPTLLVSLFGLMLAFVDIMGYAAVVEGWVRALMKHLWAWCVWTFERVTNVHTVLNYVTLGAFGVLLLVLAVDWIFGGFEVAKENVRYWGGHIIAGVQLVLALAAASAVALWAVWAIFWLLAWPRTGVISSLGLVLAIAGVALEFA
jgi:hypothetical protein